MASKNLPVEKDSMMAIPPSAKPKMLGKIPSVVPAQTGVCDASFERHTSGKTIVSTIATQKYVDRRTDHSPPYTRQYPWNAFSLGAESLRFGPDDGDGDCSGGNGECNNLRVLLRRALLSLPIFIQP